MNTNPASGYEGALEILARGNAPVDVGRSILFMSDGAPVTYRICEQQYYDWEDAGIVQFDLQRHCFEKKRRSNQRPSLAEYTRWTDEAQAAANSDGVNTYTVFYGSPEFLLSDDPGRYFLEDHVLAGPDAFAGVAVTRAQITDRFLDVCTDLTSP